MNKIIIGFIWGVIGTIVVVVGLFHYGVVTHVPAQGGIYSDAMVTAMLETKQKEIDDIEANWRACVNISKRVIAAIESNLAACIDLNDQYTEALKQPAKLEDKDPKLGQERIHTE